MNVLGCGSSVSVSGAEALQSRYMGEFAIVPGLTRGSRPVYQNNGNDAYLYVTPSENWMFGDNFDVAGGGVYAPHSSGIDCPHDVESWLVHNNGWQTTPMVTVTCSSG